MPGEYGYLYVGAIYRTRVIDRIFIMGIFNGRVASHCERNIVALCA